MSLIGMQEAILEAYTLTLPVQIGLLLLLLLFISDWPKASLCSQDVI